jgi:3-oxoacyl-[acyl-carrier-protein] synthase-3
MQEIRARAPNIEQKTGLRERRFFSENASPADVGIDLLELLMADADWAELDAVLVSSSSTQGFPGVSQQIASLAKGRRPELGNPFVLDLSSNACTGFMYALAVGTSLCKAMNFRKVAILAIEFSSRCISYEPEAFSTSMLFGDAAAGILIQGGQGGIASVQEVRASSRLNESTLGLIQGGGMQSIQPDVDVPESARWSVVGPQVAVGATQILADEIKRYQGENVSIDWLIPHQANLTRVLLPACKAAGLHPSRMRTTFDWTGNTSSASIPLALDLLVQGEQLRDGQTALLVGFGASFTIGSAMLVLRGGAQEAEAPEVVSWKQSLPEAAAGSDESPFRRATGPFPSTAGAAAAAGSR